MKGIILAGGLGTRLYPTSLVVNKNLMPVFDKPMIYYPLTTLMLAGIKEILLVSSPQHLSSFQTLLGNGRQWGIELQYAEQVEPLGIAEVFIIGEKFINNGNVCLILGDNLLDGAGLQTKMATAITKVSGATLFAYRVNNPEHYGIVELDSAENPIKIVEKPSQTRSNLAVTGLYFYDSSVVQIAKKIEFSARRQLEITDVNAQYLLKRQIHIEILDDSYTWMDMGTPEALLSAANYVQTRELQTKNKLGCPEEMALRKGYISKLQLQKLLNELPDNDYVNYLNKLLLISSA